LAFTASEEVLVQQMCPHFPCAYAWCLYARAACWDAAYVHIKSARALTALRELLAEAGVANAQVCRTHDCRRGHAEDLRRGGARLFETQIPAAGDGKSAAFVAYFDEATRARSSH